MEAAPSPFRDGNGLQKAPISVAHPWTRLEALLLIPLRWGALDPTGAKGLKETWSGSEGGEEEEVVEGEEEDRRPRGEALVAL